MGPPGAARRGQRDAEEDARTAEEDASVAAEEDVRTSWGWGSLVSLRRRVWGRAKK